ncbi:bifunctional riboflavin kinase/FAD synthetase [Phycicoccus sp. BSK3Z-2]|uniref:Riboflavin biosynthesis protein n=1 Tax=Phycicoccus avicenniae TaxID=2828860 RepID=A0A941DC05_9MICO|nr:bifunctional riboflavin kinase/FAD synthetase [Phycicoccus avicenniae]MBR7744888.1 bifunctional riboflavin kinase/FAD synthetase [Phycicoccus avicenniae]
MHRWTEPNRTPEQLRPCVVTLGNFDGVHRGHKAVLAALAEVGARLDLPTVAVTFEPHPLAVLHPDRAPDLIAPGAVRDDLLEDAGLDGLLVLPFTREFAQQSPEDFVRDLFVRDLDARAVVVGADTRFGVRNSGDVGTLTALGEEHGFEVVALEDVGDGERWSSSAVRRALVAGDVAEAARVLGRPHRVVGTVVHGNHRGRDLGYPTANLAADALGLVPEEGVYAGWLTRVDQPPDSPDRTMPAAVSVGTNPTFDTRDRRTVEAYVLGRDDLDLYGEVVMVEFVEHVRPTLRFESVEELTEAMAGDVERCRELLARIVPG